MTVMVPLVSSLKCKEPFLGRLKSHITLSFNPYYIIIMQQLCVMNKALNLYLPICHYLNCII